MNELYLIKSGDNGFVEETSAVISADSGEISINDSLYVESAGNIGIGSSNPVNKLDVVGSASISSDLTVNGITFSNVGGYSPSEANDIIMYNGSDWVITAASQLPGGGGGASNSDVPAGLINTLAQGQAIHEVNFGFDDTNARIVYDNVPKIAASLEIDGPGEIIPHTVSGVSESGYFVVFSEELPTANYRMHTVFGGTDAFWETGVANLEYSERSVDITRSLYVGQKVGIGTTSPAYKLDVHGWISAQADALSTDAVINLAGSNASNYSAISRIKSTSESDSSGASSLSFYTRKDDNTISEKMRITSGGNVGIGTTSPSSKLVVDPGNVSAGGAWADSALAITNPTNIGSYSQISFGYDVGTTNAAAYLGFLSTNQGSNGFGDLVFGTRSVNTDTAPTERVRITSVGNVGIGTTSPIYPLDVYGFGKTIGITSTHSDTTRITHASLSTDTNGYGRLGIFSNAGNPICHLDSNGVSYINGGNVGIGTTIPGAVLELAGGGTGVWLKTNNITNRSSMAGQNYINLTNQIPTDENTFEIGPGYINLNRDDNTAINQLSFGMNGALAAAISVGGGSSAADHSLRFKVGRNDDNKAGLERMRIAQNGNVGIGTTSPGTKLDVIGRGKFDSLIGNNGLNLASNGANNLNLYHGIFGSTAALGVSIASGGSVGIGTTNPAQKLDVHGNIAVNGTTIHTSDDRVKHNEQEIVGALETLSKITPKKYIKTIEMYDANHDFELDADGNPIDSNGEPVEHRIEAGVIAQQVLTVDELAFAVSPEGVDEDGKVTSPHGLDYNSLFTYAIAAIQEQQQIIDDLKSRIENLEK